MNPVLREGNSDRRAAIAVKNYARANPHSMGTWSADSKTHVSTMSSGDFRSNETSVTVTEAQAGPARIELVAKDGSVSVLKDGVTYPAGTVVDATLCRPRPAGLPRRTGPRQQGMRASSSRSTSKATMMKVSTRSFSAMR